MRDDQIAAIIMAILGHRELETRRDVGQMETLINNKAKIAWAMLDAAKRGASTPPT